MSDFETAVVEAVKARLSVPFCAKQWVEGELYDCISFVASVYQELGVIGKIELPEYSVFGKGNEMRDLICEVVEETKGFTKSSREPVHGDLVVFSAKGRGHHAGIFLEGGEVAHCVVRRGVVVDSFIPPISDGIYRVYSPKHNDL